MRRKDREVKDPEEIRTILEGCKVCRLGLLDEGAPYIVPMNAAWDFDGESLVFYFHCAKEGKKLEMIRKNPGVGFEMDREIALVEGDMPCQYSYKFASIIGKGTAEIVEDEKEKAKVLTKFMKHQSGKDFDDFEKNPEIAGAVAVIRVTAKEYTCKQNR